MTTPIDLYNFAEKIVTDFKSYPQTDVYRRAVTNRLYYSAFHASKLYHEGLPCPGSVGNSNGIHQQLISSLDNPSIPKNDDYYKSRALAKSLRIAIFNRANADYKLKDPIAEDEFEETIFHCKLIVEKATN